MDALNSIAHKVVRALDQKGAHDVFESDVLPLLMSSPRYSKDQRSTNALIHRKLGINFLEPALSFEGNLLAIGVTDAELDEMLG